eukprot:553362_1
MPSLPAAAVVTLACYCMTQTPQTDTYYEHYQRECSKHKDMASCADDRMNNCIGSRGGHQTDLLSTINYFQGAKAIQIKENEWGHMIRLDVHGDQFIPMYNGALAGAGIQHAHDPAKEIFYSWDRCYNTVKFATEKIYFNQWFTENEHFDFYRPSDYIDSDYTDVNFYDYLGINKIRFKETDGIGVIYKINPDGTGGIICTVFAISPWHLLTASHCLYNGDNFLGIDNVKIIFPELGSFSVEATPQIIQNKGYDIDWVMANAIALQNQDRLSRDITYDYGIIKVVDDKPMTHFWKIGHSPIEAIQEHTTRGLPHQFQISGYPGYAHYKAQYIVKGKAQPTFRGARLISNPLTVTIHDTEYVGQAITNGQKIYQNVGMSGGIFWLDLDDTLLHRESKKSIILKNSFELQRTGIPIAYGIQSSVQPYADGSQDATAEFYDISRGTTSTNTHPNITYNIIDGKICCHVVPVHSDYVVKINQFRYSIIQSLVKYQFNKHAHPVPRSPRSAHTKTAHAQTDYVNYKLDNGNLRYKHPYKQPRYIEKPSLSYLSIGLILVFELVSFVGLALFVMLICTFIGLFTVYVYAKHYRRYKCEQTSMDNSFV